MDVDDTVDPSGHVLAHVVLLSLANLVRLEIFRAGRERGSRQLPWQDGLRSIGLVVHRTGHWDSLWSGSRRKRARRAGSVEGAGFWPPAI